MSEGHLPGCFPTELRHGGMVVFVLRAFITCALISYRNAKLTYFIPTDHMAKYNI